MITIKRSEHTTDLSLPASGVFGKKSHLLSPFNRMEFHVFDQTNLVFESLFGEILNAVVETHHVSLVFVESQPQSKTAIRTHKKLFSDLKKQTRLTEKSLFEIEIDVEKNSSLLAGMIQISQPINSEDLKKLLHSNFRFAFLSQKDGRRFPISRQKLLEKLTNERLPNLKIVKIDIEKVLQFNQNVLHIKPTGNSEEIAEVFFQPSDLILENALRNIESKFRAAVEN